MYPQVAEQLAPLWTGTHDLQITNLTPLPTELSRPKENITQHRQFWKLYWDLWNISSLRPKCLSLSLRLMLDIRYMIYVKSFTRILKLTSHQRFFSNIRLNREWIKDVNVLQFGTVINFLMADEWQFSWTYCLYFSFALSQLINSSCESKHWHWHWSKILDRSQSNLSHVTA